jgi:hypothetical protein
MGPIEYLWLILAGFFALIGMVRGFLKELGVTIVLIATLFGLDRLIPLTEQLMRDGKLEAIGLKPLTGNAQVDRPEDLTLMIIFQAIMILAVFIAYQGETLAYEGTNPRFPMGPLLSFLVGAVNGYLISGTLWWILDHYQYPVSSTVIQLPLTPLAQSIVNNKLLPLDLLGGGTQSVDSLGLLPVILVVLIILKVVR